MHSFLKFSDQAQTFLLNSTYSTTHDISPCKFYIFLKLRKSTINFYYLITNFCFPFVTPCSKCYSLHLVTMLEISTHDFLLPSYIKIHIQNTFLMPPLSIYPNHLMCVSVVSKLLLPTLDLPNSFYM